MEAQRHTAGRLNAGGPRSQTAVGSNHYHGAVSSGLQRVRAALDINRADRPAVGLWGHDYVNEWNVSGLAASTAQRALDSGLDFVKFQPRACSFAESLGARYRPSGVSSEGPVLVEPAVRTVNDWESIALEDRLGAALTDQVECIGQLVSALGLEVPVLQTVFSPLTVAAYMIEGDSRLLLEQLQGDEPRLAQGLDRIASMLVRFSAASVEAGAAGIFYAISGYASDDFMTADQYSRLVGPHDVKVLASLPKAAWFNALHLCRSHIHFGLARQYPVQAISWDIHATGNPDLAQGQALSGKAVMGGLSQECLTMPGSEALQRQAVDAAVSVDGRGLLLAAGCSIPPGVPTANLKILGSVLNRVRPVD